MGAPDLAGNLICRLRGTRVAATPEERIRQAVIAELFALGYPWHLWRAEAPVPRLAAVAARADLAFCYQPGSAAQAAAIIEVKAHPPGEGDRQQAFWYAKALGAQLVAVTDGSHWTITSIYDVIWSQRARFPYFSAWQARAH